MQADIVYQIRATLESLSTRERKVAEAILADVDFAARAAIGDLAERAGVSLATISRFARSVGCTNVRELKLRLARAGAVGARFLAPQAEENVFYGRIVNDISTTLQHHLGRFSEADFQTAAAQLRAARMVYIVGMGGTSTMLADELQFRLVRLGIRIATYHDAVLARMVATSVSKDDVFICLSTTGLTPELLDIASTARDYGANLIALTHPESPLAALAGVVLPLDAEETDFIFKPSASRYAMLLAVDILATEVALADKQDSQERLRRIKLALDQYRGGGNRTPLGD